MLDLGIAAMPPPDAPNAALEALPIPGPTTLQRLVGEQGKGHLPKAPRQYITKPGLEAMTQILTHSILSHLSTPRTELYKLKITMPA